MTLKDSIFQGSTPIRHAAELLAINTSKERLATAFVLAFTDGGPDHNISFLNVILSWLGYFIMSKSDFLVVARTTPTQSWTNPAERLMSVLNLSLSNCALSREPMSEEFEKKMKKRESMSSVRKVAGVAEESIVAKEVVNDVATPSSPRDPTEEQASADATEALTSVQPPSLALPLASSAPNEGVASIDVVAST
jgi:hypothetical protein